MDIAHSPDALSLWLIHYGSFALFFLMLIGIVVFPIPEETLMVLSGILIQQGKLHFLPTAIAAYLGAISGITISYFLGRLAGKFLLQKYGSWIGITEERLKKVHRWFERFGKWALLIGYFFPGIRHFTGFSAGSTYLSYRQFALFAYSGALVWATIFLSIGYFFGSVWIKLYEEIEISFDVITLIVVLAALFIIIYFVKKFGKKK